jgi:hypothetical protein
MEKGLHNRLRRGGRAPGSHRIYVEFSKMHRGSGLVWHVGNGTESAQIQDEGWPCGRRFELGRLPVGDMHEEYA